MTQTITLVCGVGRREETAGINASFKVALVSSSIRLALVNEENVSLTTDIFCPWRFTTSAAYDLVGYSGKSVDD